MGVKEGGEVGEQGPACHIFCLCDRNRHAEAHAKEHIRRNPDTHTLVLVIANTLCQHFACFPCFFVEGDFFSIGL